MKVPAATGAFLKELEARKISTTSIRKFELLFEALKKFADYHRYVLQDLSVPQIREFRSTWKWGPLTQAKYLERLRQFFRFCQQNSWTD